MTVPVALQPSAPALSTVTLLRRSLAAEWFRLWTVRSTWWALLAAAGMAVVVAAGLGVDEGDDGVPVWVAGELAVVVAQLPLLVLVMLAVTSDHATGAIRSSLQWVPRRGILLTTRTVVAVSVATVAGLLVAVMADAVMWLWVREFEIVEVLASLGDLTVLLLTGAFVTVGLATVLRSSAGTLTSAFLLLLALPIMLPEFGVRWLAWVGRSLPGMALALLASFEGPPIGLRELAPTLAAWVVGATAVAGWLFVRRDAA